MKIINPEVQIKIPALKRPTLKELQKSWSYIDSIERDISTEKTVTLSLATVLNDGETYISGSEYEKRLGDGLLGFQHMQWILKNQKKYPELMALIGKVYIDFPGLIVVNGDGDRRVPFVYDGEQFTGDWDWLDDDFHVDGRVAVSRKSLKSLTPNLDPLESLTFEEVKKLKKFCELIKD